MRGCLLSQLRRVAGLSTPFLSNLPEYEEPELMGEASRDWLRLPVVTAGSEHLVMGHLMRRNILTYKAPPGNEGYDLICLHPEPRHQPGLGEKAQVRVQVKSRYATGCDRGFPVKGALSS